MDQDIKVAEKLTIGIDLGDRKSQLCVLDEAGEVCERGELATTPTALERRFRFCPPARIAIETGTHSPWVKRVLEDCGHEVLVANTRKIRAISGNNRKSDQVDAEFLARMARADPRLLSPIHHRSKSYQVDLAMVRSRAALVAARTRLINHVRGSVKALGARLNKCSSESFNKSAPAQIPAELIPALTPVLELITSVTAQIRQMDKQLATMGREAYPVTELLRQVGGVGPLTALCFVLTLEDPSRFKTNRSVGAYLGLIPKRKQSGGRDPQLRITKEGDVQLRCLLVLCAHYILGRFGPDSDLRRAGLALAARGGKNAKKRAVVAVARKLAVLLLSLWKTGEVYEPLRNTMAREGQAA